MNYGGIVSGLIFILIIFLIVWNKEWLMAWTKARVKENLELKKIERKAYVEESKVQAVEKGKKKARQRQEKRIEI